jgi:hypothetical protein
MHMDYLVELKVDYSNKRKEVFVSKLNPAKLD